jgi:anti-anti-sigma regulatory factor
LTTLRLADRFGPALIGRSAAADLRHEVERRVAAGERFVLDFDGVPVLSPSFADELLAKLSRATAENGLVEIVRLERSSAAFANIAAAARR